MRGTRQIHARDLQIIAVNIALVQRHRSRDRHLLRAAPPAVVIRALHERSRRNVAERHRAVLRVVGNDPNPRFRPNQLRVPVRVVSRREVLRLSLGGRLRQRRILVQRVRRIGELRSRLGRGAAVPDVVERVGVGGVPERRGSQLAPRVIAELAEFSFHEDTVPF